MGHLRNVLFFLSNPLKRIVATSVGVAAVFLFFSSTSFAANNSGITYQGRILKPDGSPLEGQTVQFRLEIRTPNTSRCLMFAEVQTRDMRNSKGVFALTMNDGTGARVDTSGLGFDRIFANRSALINFDPATCASGSSYTPNEDDGRVLAVSFRDETMVAWEPMPTQSINFVPFAIEAKQIAGYGINSLLRFDLPTASPKNTSPLSEAEYDKLVALIAGSSGDYERSGRLGGAVIPSTGSLTAGQVLSWNGTAWTASDSVPDGAVSTTKIVDAAVTSDKIANGTITGVDLATNIAITTTGTVSSNVSTARDFRIYDSDAAPNENYISLRAPPSLPSNFSYVWPANYGTNSQVLTTDGTGNLSWAAPAAASQWANGASSSINYGAGNVGIGTTTPGSLLSVAGNPYFQTGNYFQINNHVFMNSNTVNTGHTGGINNSVVLDVDRTDNAVSGLNNYVARSSTGPISEMNGISNLIGIGGAAPGTATWVRGTYNAIENSGAGVVSNAAGFMTQVRNTGGGTITNAYGVYIQPLAGTTRYGVYQEGASDRNYFAGAVGIGTSSPIQVVDVRRNDSTAIVQAMNENTTASGRFPGFHTANYMGSTSNGVPVISLQNGRGSFTTPAPLPAGLRLGSISFRGTSSNLNTEYVQGATITATSQELFSNTNAGTYLSFSTAATGTSNASERVRIGGGGNVAIGSFTPTASIHIKAGSAVAGTAPIKLTTSGSGVLLTTPEDGAMEYDSAGLWFTIGTTRYQIPMTSSGNYSNVSSINGTGSITVQTPTGSSVILNSGTASLNANSGALVVSGGMGITGNMNSTGNINTLASVNAAVGMTTPQIWGSNAASGILRLDGTSNATRGNVLIATTGGNVGIGSTNPGAKLEVAGTAYATDLGATQISIAQSGAGVYPSSTVTAYSDNGRPQMMLMRSRGTFAAQTAIGDGDDLGMIAGNGHNGTQLETASGIRFRADGTNATGSGNHPGGRIDFLTRGTVDATQYGLTPVMTILNNGNVGIGTLAPTAKLHVAGGITSTSSYTGYNFNAVSAGTYNPFVSYVSGGAANEKYWDFFHQPTTFSIRALNDGYSASNDAIRFRRTGHSIASVEMPNGNVGIGVSNPTS